MQSISAERFSAPARTIAAALIATGQHAVVQFEDGERRAYIRDARLRQKRVEVTAIEELVRAGVLADRADGLFAGLGQTYEARAHVILKTKLAGGYTDKKTGDKFRRVEIATTAGVYLASVQVREGKGGVEQAEAEEIKAAGVMEFLNGRAGKLDA